MSEIDPPVIIRPQPGPQTKFLSTKADIAIYGGAAGGGKSWALLMEPLRHINNANFGAMVFRRTTVQVRNEGGLWDESVKLYRPAGGQPKENELWWRFPSGAAITFAHLEHNKNVYDYQGAQIPLIEFDELTHFSEEQFWYMVSRNRSMCGVRPYIRASCNPDSESWVADFISWWIDQDTGYAIAERAGKLRWFVRVNDKLIWADGPEELTAYVNPVTGDPIPPKSLTFVPAKLSDNTALMLADPGYAANLMALPPVERERLFAGNWKIRWSGIDFFPLDQLMINGQPVEPPAPCDAVFAIVDSATKTGTQNDATAVVFYALNKHHATPLTIVDWDTVQIEGALLETWLPSVFLTLERWAATCRARMGSLGVWIEDKASGEILLQQARRRGLQARPIESRLTALGKDERAISVSGYHYNGKVKLSRHAFDKVVTLKGSTRNHLISQLTGFRIGDPDAAKRADDLLDCYTYGVALALGDSGGF